MAPAVNGGPHTEDLDGVQQPDLSSLRTGYQGRNIFPELPARVAHLWHTFRQNQPGGRGPMCAVGLRNRPGGTLWYKKDNPPSRATKKRETHTAVQRDARVQVQCYQNALLQILFHYPRFVHWLVEHHHAHRLFPDEADRHPECVGSGCPDCCTLRNCLSCSLKAVLCEYWTPNRTINRRRLENARDRLDRVFHYPRDENQEEHESDFLTSYPCGTGQADPQELWKWLGDSLFRQTSHPAIESLFGDVRFMEWAKCPNPHCPNHQSGLQEGEPTWIRLGKADEWWNSSIAELLQRQWRERLDSGKTCNQEDPDEPGCRSKDGLIKRQRNPRNPLHFVEAETLRPNHFCKRYFRAWPDLLCLQLDPMYGERDHRRRSHSAPLIDYQLDLTKWHLDPAVTSGGLYRLHAVIAHDGIDASSGHYKTVLRDADDRWVEFNDHVVSGPFEFVESEHQITTDFTDAVPRSVERRWSECNWMPVTVFYRRVDSGANGSEQPQNQAGSKGSSRKRGHDQSSSDGSQGPKKKTRRGQK